MRVSFFTAVMVSLGTALLFSFKREERWESRFVRLDKKGILKYTPDEEGSIFPDFSWVGYYSGDKPIPGIAIVKTISATGENSQGIIQAAIDEVAKRSTGKNGFRGAILLKKGVYKIPGTIKIETSGIVLRGEGNETRLVATSKEQIALIRVSGKGMINEINGSRVKITTDHVPVGAKSFTVTSSRGFKTGDRIIVYRPGTEQWIKDLKMDQIEARNGTKQWKADEYNFRFERMITGIEGNTIHIDNPVVLAIEAKYGGAEIFKYNFEGRISDVGIEDLYCESEYETDTSENHAWDAVLFDKIENGWVRRITSKYFGYSCVNLGDNARNVSVIDCNCFEPKSIITGGRRYSFNNTGQMNLFMNCRANGGRHDFVTGARTCGPNVFYHCSATNTHADIGPHHRWAMGTLYDNITTDGEINVQDRGNYGSGHGWAGVNQILWNCTVKRATVQSPYENGKNYCIGLKGEKTAGRFKDRPGGEWEGQNREGLQPQSLYMAQLKARKRK